MLSICNQSSKEFLSSHVYYFNVYCNPLIHMESCCAIVFFFLGIFYVILNNCIPNKLWMAIWIFTDDVSRLNLSHTNTKRKRKTRVLFYEHSPDSWKSHEKGRELNAKRDWRFLLYNEVTFIDVRVYLIYRGEITDINSSTTTIVKREQKKKRWKLHQEGEKVKKNVFANI